MNVKTNKSKSEIFANNIKTSLLEMVYNAQSSHVGSCLSIADIVAVLYTEILTIDHNNPYYSERDRFILSKGHACAIIYAALAELGFYPKSSLTQYAKDGSDMMAHISHKISGVEFSTGSLGHGLPFAVGKALASKKSNKSWRVFVCLGDGELDEGSNWEALLFAAHHKLNNLIIIVDYNKLQSLTTVANTIELEPLIKKFEAFRCITEEINGHNHNQLKNAFQFDYQKRIFPTVVVAHTVKGNNISFMEHKVEWHYRSPNTEELALALKEVAQSYA